MRDHEGWHCLRFPACAPRPTRRKERTIVSYQNGEIDTKMDSTACGVQERKGNKDCGWRILERRMVSTKKRRRKRFFARIRFSRIAWCIAFGRDGKHPALLPVGETAHFTSAREPSSSLRVPETRIGEERGSLHCEVQSQAPTARYDFTDCQQKN